MKAAYSVEPADKRTYTAQFDRFYTWFAPLYDRLIPWLPLWDTWVTSVIPYLHGPHVLEVSFGTGHLLTYYAQRYETYGIDYNRRMAQIARANLARQGVATPLLVGNVETLPFAAEMFDTVVNTMAFSGYPDAQHALSELHRVLRCGGRLLIVDANFPADGDWRGIALARMVAASGDLLRDMGALFRQYGFAHTDTEIGGWGSIHLYVATKL
jgi:ubiquinone/menaquinone biosynthesis C-methylase UbiE